MKISRGGHGGVEDAAAAPGGEDAEQLPMITAMISDATPSSSVQPIWLPMTSVTGVGKREIESPRLPVKTLAEVAEVLLPQRARRRARTSRCSCLDLVRGAVGPGARDHPRDRVSRHEAGKQEVQGDRRPERDEIEPEACAGM